MKLSAKTAINAPKEAIWGVITDIENATKNLNGVEKVEILEQPSDGLVGLKWIETRTIFGKTATETMWITEAVENKFYQTRAEIMVLFILHEWKSLKKGDNITSICHSVLRRRLLPPK